MSSLISSYFHDLKTKNDPNVHVKPTVVLLSTSQGGASRGMNDDQLEEAALRLEEAFVPAVKQLKMQASMDVVLDSLFEGQDDAGQFVVRFEVTISRWVRGWMRGSDGRAGVGGLGGDGRRNLSPWLKEKDIVSRC